MLIGPESKVGVFPGVQQNAQPNECLTGRFPCLTEGHTELMTKALAEEQIQVNRKGIIGLLELDEYQTKWIDGMSKLGISFTFHYGTPEPLTIVLDLLGFPEDDWDSDTESGFCRDWLYSGPDGPGADRPPAEEYLKWLLEERKPFLPA